MFTDSRFPETKWQDKPHKFKQLRMRRANNKVAKKARERNRGT